MWETTRKGKLYLADRAYDALTGRGKTYMVRITSDSAKGRREAKMRLEDKLNEKKQPKRLHLSDVIELYEQENERSVRESTYARNHCTLKTILSIVDDVYMDALTAGYIRRKMMESGKTNASLNELIKRFKTFLLWAYRNDYCGREIADKLTYFADRSAREKVEDKFLEKDELKTLVDAMELERWKLLTEFLALSGLRIGEAIALNSEDVSEYINVTQTYNENFHSLGDAKTRSSVREVYVQPELAEVVKRIRVCMMKQRMMYGYEDKGFFFTGIDGDRVGYKSYCKYLKQIAKETKIAKKIVPHTLRHTMTSLFAEAGVPLDVISRRLGHENSDITRRIYLHITKTHKIKDNASITSITLLA